MRKYLPNVHKMGGAHFQCMNNNYGKIEYKGMKTVGVTVYTNQTPLRISDRKMSKKNEKIFIKCAQNRWYASSICEQLLCKV